MDQSADILGGLPFPALLIDQDGRTVLANPLAQTLLGPAIVGRPHGFALRAPEVLDAIAQVATTRQPATARLTLPGPSHEANFRVTVAPVGPGVLCTFQDISDLEQGELMRRDFVANVSHELRTPLTSLIGFIETLRGAARDDPAARARFLDTMAAQAGRMNRLIQALLHLSRVEAQERQRPALRHDLGAVVQAALQTLRPLAEQTGVTLVVQGLDQKTSLLIDPDQMTQVVANLVENAIKYGAAGGRVVVALSRETGPRGPQVRLDVTDQGEGIDPMHIPRLTERFYRIDSHRSREQGGTGLGLAIVKHIAHRHRGRLHIDSTPGQGSTFSVILPAD